MSLYEGLGIVLHKKIMKRVSECVIRWGLIESGDRIMVGFSGGKDSFLLIHVLEHLRKVAPVDFSFGIFHLNQGYPDDFSGEVLKKLSDMGYRVDQEDLGMRDIFSQKLKEGDSPCGLCSRLRRGILYTQSRKLGYNKIALGHHREDAIETFLMNAMYNGQIKSMPPKLISDDGQYVVIRPMLYVPEAMVIEASKHLRLAVVKGQFCSMECCGSRYEMKQLLEKLALENPKIPGNLLRSMHCVVGSHLMDESLHT